MDLSEVRKQIDIVDAQIKDLFLQRMALADQVAQVKATTGDHIFKADREIAIIETQSADLPLSIKREYIALIKKIMNVSREYQYGKTLELRNCLDITWQTEPMIPSTIALIGDEAEICPIPSGATAVSTLSFSEAGSMVSQNKVDAGMGIIEEIGIGISTSLHTALVNNNLYVNECHIVSRANTKMKVALFSRYLVVLPEHNRLKVMFTCHNESGTLANILSMIGDYNANLTEIHSRPNQAEEWNYEFYVEFEGNLLHQDTQALVFQLRSETQSFQILGSYFCESNYAC